MSRALLRAPPDDPTPVPWAPWVSILDASSDWQVSGYSRLPELKELFSSEGLTSFTSDHPNNPVTTRFFEPIGDEGGPVVAAMHFDERAEGAPGYAHEGAIGAGLDSLLGFCNMVNNAGGPTLNLTLRFCQPVPLGTCLRCDVQLTHSERSKVFLKGSMVDGTDPSIVYVECDGLWFNPWGKNVQTKSSGTAPAASFMTAEYQENALRGLSAKHPSLNIQSKVKVTDTPWVSELVADQAFSVCTGLVAEGRDGEVGGSFVTNSARIKVEYFVSSSVFIGAFLVCGECMGPPPNIHGGCIFSLHSDSVIACMRIRAVALGVEAEKGTLKVLSVNFRKLTPLWHTYAVRVHIVSHMRDLGSGCWKFVLRSEMVNPETGIVHSDADSEFECGAEGLYHLLPHELTKPYGGSHMSAL